MVQDKNKDNTAYLRLILDSFKKINDFTLGMSDTDFFNDSKTQSAVIMQLQVVGELSKKILNEIKNSIDLPWKNIAGLRDMVAHDYFGLDLVTIWYTVQVSVPEAEGKIKKYLADMGI